MPSSRLASSALTFTNNGGSAAVSHSATGDVEISAPLVAPTVTASALVVGGASSFIATSTFSQISAETVRDVQTLEMDGSTSGTLIINPAATTTNYTITLPAAQGSADTFLKNNGAGSLTWTAISAAGSGGANTQVQFNDAGQLGGDASFTFDTASKQLTTRFSTSTGSGNIATNTSFGSLSLNANTTGSSNAGVGYASLQTNTTGSNNTSFGARALDSNTTGSQNTAIGTDSLGANTTQGHNTALGFNALLLNTVSGNTAIGSGSLDANTTGGQNTAVGRDSLGANTTGGGNTAVGRDSLIKNETGGSLTAIGAGSLYWSTTGDHNTATGQNTLFYNTSGSNNTAVGSRALAGTGCTAGSNDTAIGAFALSQNTYVGGGGNIQIGGQDAAGSYTPVFTLTDHTNHIVMGSSNVTSAQIKVGWTVVSDVRDKTDFGPVPHGLDFIGQVNPISYRFRANRESAHANGPKRYGFSAQDILALEGENSVIIDSRAPQGLCMNETQMIPVLVNAIKELKSMVEALQTARANE